MITPDKRNKLQRPSSEIHQRCSNVTVPSDCITSFDHISKFKVRMTIQPELEPQLTDKVSEPIKTRDKSLGDLQ